jgi:hypothetical protein
MKLCKTAVAAALSFACAAPALRAEPPLRGGEHEIEAAAAVVDDTTEIAGVDVDTTAVTLSFRGGRFVTRNHELGLILGYAYGDSEGTRTRYGNAGVFYDFNLPGESRIVPLAGVAAQTLLGDVEGSAYEASAGVRLFASDDVSFNWRVYYSVTDAEYDGFPGEVESRQVGMRVGFSWVFR